MPFENAQVRITRVRVAPGDAVGLTAADDQPVLLAALVPTDIARVGGANCQIETGGAAWLDAGTGAILRPIGHASEVLPGRDALEVDSQAVLAIYSAVIATSTASIPSRVALT